MTIFAQVLVNPGAEAGNTSGWTLRSGAALNVGTSSPPPHSGSYRFGMDTGFDGGSVWDQEVALDPSLYAAIDANLAAFDATSWLFADAVDTGSLYIECRDAGSVLISTFATPQALAPAWDQQDLIEPIPPNTRFLRIGTNNLRNLGSVFNVYWDDFALDVSDNKEADYPGTFAPKASQIVLYSFGQGEDTTYQLRGSQISAYAWAIQPAEQLRSSQEVIITFGMGEDTTYQLRAHQIATYAWAKGYVEKPHVRSWGFSLDGHDFYVLRLGVNSTLVLDLTTGQWSDWSGHNLPVWRAVCGQNWLGMGKTTADRLYGTNIVAGDDRVGVLWMLDPAKGVDDGPAADVDDQPYTRTTTGAVPMTMRQTQRDGAIYLTISLGQPVVTGAAITLRISDDWGKSYRDAGSITVEPSNYTQEIAWRSVGLIRAPGRLYQFEDQGAAVRIAYAERR